MLQVMTTKIVPPKERRLFSLRRTMTNEETDLELICNHIRHVCRYDWMLFEQIQLDAQMGIDFALIGPKGLFLILVNEEPAVLLSDRAYHVEQMTGIQKVETHHPVTDAQNMTKAVRTLLKAEGIVIPVQSMLVFKNAPKLRLSRVKFSIGHTFASLKPWIAQRQGTPVTEKERKQVAYLLTSYQK
ncbi:nuclease-related domain-containing protein [Exiguobacterium sp. s193]|uniref:nuclease-related domain-containing protein n=1 Tax=Exiguobacterium sp. s193 TaxID=2751207 RepID=UPI001BE6708E|nr:nuclease-related domain-containing protein [Exiguobacterium sp. s193]